MITEDYVSFETAKLLREKGFDCACKVWYSEYTSQFGGEKYTSIEFDNHNKFNENYKFICSAPTLQMAMKWLREVHKIYIQVVPLVPEYYEKDEYVYRFQYKRLKHIPIYDKMAYIDDTQYITYEKACDAAIKYCLENLI